ncbi:hypothetical protein TEA_011683 [Camellia sinensis var. sinensis]|uniref:FAD synthase n=1 Tax=Camellia sinensis var. sinensis TaxID=542762 RepID=A0A4S4EAD0_CAMSN|nr:hypothetical protein TEA_011683 [Camellia sinensis var. sinensis]
MVWQCCGYRLGLLDEASDKERKMRRRWRVDGGVELQASFAMRIEEVAFSFNGGKDSTVLLHLLRAGYFLHQVEQSDSNGDLTDCDFTFPIRTIYFESSSAFPEINSFTYETASTCNSILKHLVVDENYFSLSSYGVLLDIIRLDFKSGLEALLKANPIRAIFLGVRIGDPTAVGQEQFSPSSSGWPPFMRVNPILDWSYRDVWAFLLTCKVRYCSLYDQGYTSIGSIHDTVPNALLCIKNSDSSKEKFRAAYMLPDGRLERAGRAKKYSTPVCGRFLAVGNGLKSVDMNENGILTASVIAVGDELLFGTIEDQLGPSLCRKLCSIGWAVSQIAVVRNDIDSVADEVERQKSANDLVFIYGGVGPLHSDVTVSGVAKAFGVRMAPDEEFEEYLRHLISDKCTGDRNEMAQLPEGITELLHHEKLPVPLLYAKGLHKLDYEAVVYFFSNFVIDLINFAIKCLNVIILTATNVTELDGQWDCLIELTSSSGLLALAEPFVSKRLRTTQSDVELINEETGKHCIRMGMEWSILHMLKVLVKLLLGLVCVETAQPLSKLCLEFPDLYIGCYRESRTGPLVISFEGKDQSRVEAAAEAHCKKFHPGAFYEIN